jgi:hypothetical protein
VIEGPEIRKSRVNRLAVADHHPIWLAPCDQLTETATAKDLEIRMDAWPERT